MARKNVGKWGRVIDAITQPDIARRTTTLKDVAKVQTHLAIEEYPFEITGLAFAPGDTDDWSRTQRITPDDKKPQEYRQAKDSFTSMNDAITDPGALSKSSSPNRYKKHPGRVLESARDDQGRPNILLRASGSVDCPVCKKLVEPSRTVPGPNGMRVCDKLKNPNCRDMDVSKSKYLTRD